jgi:hypothetical protein
MTSKELISCLRRAGAPVTPGLEVKTEYVRNTERKMLDGIEFRSTHEANCYQLLKFWQQAGAIRNLKLQPCFLLQEKFRRDGKAIREIKYTADFQFERTVPASSLYQNAWNTVVIEAKGHKTEAFKMRRKMFLKRYPELRYEMWTRQTLEDLSR